MSAVMIQRTALQSCVYNQNKTLVVKPQIGSILFRLDRKLAKLDEFVVVNTTHKSSGNNKNIIDRAVLRSVLGTVRNSDGIQAQYSKNSELILYLTNRGSWWTRSLEKDYVFSWNVAPPQDTTIIQPYVRQRSL